MGRAPFHLLQALELAVLLLCVLWGGDGGETVWRAEKGPWACPSPSLASPMEPSWGRGDDWICAVTAASRQVSGRMEKTWHQERRWGQKLAEMGWGSVCNWVLVVKTGAGVKTVGTRTEWGDEEGGTTKRREKRTVRGCSGTASEVRGLDLRWEGMLGTGLEGLGPQVAGNRSSSTPSPPHRLQFVLKILIFSPNDADRHQAMPGEPWGLRKKRTGFSPQRSPPHGPPVLSPLGSLHSPPLGPRRCLPPWALQGWGKRRGRG